MINSSRAVSSDRTGRAVLWCVRTLLSYNTPYSTEMCSIQSVQARFIYYELHSDTCLI